MELANNWVCDKCGKIIEKPDDGYIEWFTSPTKGFQIVHHIGPNYLKCLYDKRFAASNQSLADCFEPSGLMGILELLSQTGFSKEDTIEIIKRIYVFGYDLIKADLKSAMENGVFAPNTPLGFPTAGQIQAVLVWKENGKY